MTRAHRGGDVAVYIECEDCGFVLLSASSADPVPKRVDSCPDCGASEFRFTEE